MEHLKILTGLLKQANFPETLASIAHISGQDPVLPSPFLIGTGGATALAALGIAAEQLQQAKTGEAQEISISNYEAAIAQRSHMYVRVLEKEIADLWSPISGFYQTGDQRWIQLHCNFPNHRLGVVEFLQCADNKEAVTQAILQHEALSLETALSEQGLCAAMVRSPEEWAQHPQAQAVATLHLPAQSLDYITGWLAAFATMVALKRRATEGGSYHVRLSLAQTAHWFKDLGRIEQFADCKNPARENISDYLEQVVTPFGTVEHLKPVLQLTKTSPKIFSPAVPLGHNKLAWAEMNRYSDS
jgi:hypothetical protein